MSNRSASRVWFALGLTTLIGLWVAIAQQPAAVSAAGFAFLFSPIVAAATTHRSFFRSDPVSALCVLGLAVLFCVAWFARA